jgi:hypothetical protein
MPIPEATVNILQLPQQLCGKTTTSLAQSQQPTTARLAHVLPGTAAILLTGCRFVAMLHDLAKC